MLLIRQHRHELSALLGFKSFAHKSLARKVLSSPEAVRTMIDKLFEHMKRSGGLLEEYKVLSEHKLKVDERGTDAVVYPVRNYYKKIKKNTITIIFLLFS